MNITTNIRATDDNDKNFMGIIFQKFATSFGKAYQKVKSVEIDLIHFGKTDSRGKKGITLYDKRGCIEQSIKFDKLPELINFVEGYLFALRYKP